MALVVEPEAVDDRPVFRQAEQARFRVARLRARGDGAHLQKAKPQPGEAGEGIGILVKPGREAHPVGKRHAPEGDGSIRQALAAIGHKAVLEGGDGQIVRGFGGGGVEEMHES